jgi:hypothetical protein
MAFPTSPEEKAWKLTIVCNGNNVSGEEVYVLFANLGLQHQAVQRIEYARE